MDWLVRKTVTRLNSLFGIDREQSYVQLTLSFKRERKEGESRLPFKPACQKISLRSYSYLRDTNIWHANTVNWDQRWQRSTMTSILSPAMLIEQWVYRRDRYQPWDTTFPIPLPLSQRTIPPWSFTANWYQIKAKSCCSHRPQNLHIFTGQRVQATKMRRVQAIRITTSILEDIIELPSWSSLLQAQGSNLVCVCGWILTDIIIKHSRPSLLRQR